MTTTDSVHVTLSVLKSWSHKLHRLYKRLKVICFWGLVFSVVTGVICTCMAPVSAHGSMVV